VRLILASASPRRAHLLRAAGFTFEIFAVDVDEQFIAGETAEHYVARLAETKARVAAASLGRVEKRGTASFSDVVLGADTTVVSNGEVLGKPAGKADAERMIRLLAGRTHEVLTGIHLLRGDRSLAHLERSQVRMSAMTEAEIAWYIASGEPMDKAGGYAAQGLASRFIEGIDGSYSNVVGLPVARVQNLLKALGCDILTV
jgi:nucleoside triphosphate pyrophosphatase